MSAVLQRLVGRATGAVSGGLRPRLPSLFEMGSGESGLREVHTEMPAEATERTPSRAAAGEDEQAVRPIAVAADPPSQPRQPTAWPVNAETSPPAAAKPTIEPRPQDGARSASLSPASTAVAPEPLLPEPAPAQVEPILLPQVETARRDGGLTVEPAGASVEPPAPLLTPEPKPLMAEAMTVAMHRRPAARGPDRRPATASTPDQEVVIHIGRLDIRADPPKPARTPRTVERPSPPSLSDYLRGGRR